MTNRQIQASLHIKDTSARNLVIKVLAKLGFTRRSQVAASRQAG